MGVCCHDPAISKISVETGGSLTAPRYPGGFERPEDVVPRVSPSENLPQKKRGGRKPNEGEPLNIQQGRQRKRYAKSHLKGRKGGW